MKDQEDYFKVLRKIQQNPRSSQRELAEDIGFSLGKLNYCLKALRDKGLIKIENFKNNPNKLNYVYILTPKGMSEKTKLTLNFMKKKMKEYDDLKKELEN
jgi:EPS-associated MarR family transcriptional regulator